MAEVALNSTSRFFYERVKFARSLRKQNRETVGMHSTTTDGLYRFVN